MSLSINTMIKGIQVLGIIFCIYLLIQTYIRNKKGLVGIKSLVFWASMWLIILILFLSPSLTLLIAPILNTADAMLMVLVIGSMTLFTIIFHQSMKITQLEQKLTKIAQNISLTNYFTEMGEKSEE